MAPLVFIIGLYYSNANLSLTYLVQIVILSFPFSIILYGINDLYDYNSDKLNPRKNVLEFGKKNKFLVEKSSVDFVICAPVLLYINPPPLVFECGTMI